MNELKHYGVLGMKWGVRKAKKNGTTYKYKSRATKRYEIKAELAKSSGDKDKYAKMSRKAKRSADFDSKLQKEATRMKSGETLASEALLGLWGTTTYAALRASGNSGAMSAAGSFAAGYLAGPIGQSLVTQLSRYRHVND